MTRAAQQRRNAFAECTRRDGLVPVLHGLVVIAAQSPCHRGADFYARFMSKTLSDFALGGCLMGEMQEPTDTQLLRDYAEHRNEAAFRELVSRHADVVYASALRQVSSPDLAQDIAQSVFTDLARKAQPLAGTLTGETSLLGWLFRSTRFLALNQLRDDRRRQARERHAMQHFDPASETAPEWERVQPVLDEAMADLSDEDREALLLRFFKNRDFRAVGAALGVSDDAAQKRVSRALERLRTQLTSRGVTTTAIALSTVLSTNAVPLAPAGLATTLSTAALAGTTLATTATAAAVKTIAMTTLQKTVITAIVAAAVGTGMYQARQASTLRTEVQTLRQQQAPLAEQIQQLTKDRDDDSERLDIDRSELLRLRGEVGLLRQQQAEAVKQQSGLDKLRLENFHTRTFSINIDYVLQNLEKQIQFKKGEPISEAIRKFFEQNGVPFEPPSDVYFNETQGVMLIRSTHSNWDAVSSLISVLNTERQ